MLLKILLNNLCSEIITVRNGTEAVEICRSQDDFDLILMDIQLPKLDGYKATEQIRKFNSTVIIIAQTAFAFAGDREKVLYSGFNDYISKPINKEKLFNLINSYF